MFDEMKLIYGHDGLNGLLNASDMDNAKRMDAMSDVFDHFNADKGAAILALPVSDAAALYTFAGYADTLASRILNDPNAGILEIMAAIRLKAAASQTMYYISRRPDFGKILETAKRLGDHWEEVISPIIERHEETGALAKGTEVRQPRI